MSWHDQIAEGFPHRHDQEPGQLRSDIVDELADHLSCAMDRELRRADDEATARRAVLERFGNPVRIARKLWFDAMKETVMKDRMMMIAAALMAVACIALALFAMSAIQQGREVNEAILARLDAMESAGPPRDLEWGAAKLQLVNPPGQDGSLSGIKVELTGNAINPSEGAVLTQLTNSEGAAEFDPIRPGTFSLRVYGEGGLWHERTIVVMPGGERNEQLAWPGRFPLADVSFEIDWPDDLEDKGLLLCCDLEPKATTLRLEGAKWQGLRSVRLMLDGDGAVLEQALASPRGPGRSMSAGDGAALGQVLTELLSEGSSLDPPPPDGWGDTSAIEPKSATARLIAQHYEFTRVAVYGPSYDPQVNGPYSHTRISYHSSPFADAPIFEATGDDSANTWRLLLPDSVSGGAREHPGLAHAWLRDQLTTLCHGELVRRLPITRVRTATDPDNWGPRGTSWAQGLCVETGRYRPTSTLFLQLPIVPADEAASQTRRFVLAMHATGTSDTEANCLQMHEVLGDWDGKGKSTAEVPPKVSDEVVAEYGFETDPGWKLFDVTRLVRRRAKRGGEAFGVMLRFADPEEPARYKFERDDRDMVRAPFQPALLVVEAGEAAD